MCSWEQTEDKERPSLRQRLAAMSERLWNPGHDEEVAAFEARLSVADSKLTTLLDGSPTT